MRSLDIFGIWSNRAHGFLLDRGRFTAINFPAAGATVAEKVNDAGQVVGYYIDTTGVSHGFLYQHGGFAQVDFPGSSDTIVYGINSAGDIAGSYDDADFVTYSFTRRNGTFRSFDPPGAAQSEAYAINDQEIVAGTSWNDPFAGPYTGFIKNRRFSRFMVPGSVTAITVGYVSKDWAKTHHHLWYNDVTGKTNSPE